MIRINNVNRFALTFSFLALLMPYQSYAERVDFDKYNDDWVYLNHSGATWGQTFKRIFKHSSYNKSYALVIGISHYNNFSDLATKNDAIKMKNFLLNEAGFDAVHLITGDKVTLNRIRTIMMDDLPRRLGRNDRFLFYWSGHGVTDKVNGQSSGYLPVSRSRSNQFSSMIDMRFLSSWDSRLKVKQSLYLLDACFSGLASHQVKSTQRNLTIQQISRPSRQILTAGLDNEEAIVIEGMGSLFTTAVIEGARGKADTAQYGFRKDGIVSARELELYVKKRVDQEREKNNWRKPITPLLTRFKHQPGDFFFYSKAIFQVQPTITVTKTTVIPKSTGNKAQANYHYHGVRGHSHPLPSGGLHHRHGNDAWGKRQSSGIVSQPRKAIRNLIPNKGRRIGQYIDHGDGTITDTKTGLMWRKCPEDNNNHCQGQTYTWNEAMRRFNNNSFSSYENWRIPTKDQLKSLISCKINIITPLRDLEVCSDKFPGFKNNRPKVISGIFPEIRTVMFWTKSEINSNSAWAVSFFEGGTFIANKTNRNYILLVK